MTEKDAIIVDLGDYEHSGEGANGTSYNHKTDADTMIKLYNSNQNIRNVIGELEFARKVFEAGISTPKPGELITDGQGRYGMKFKRIVGKKSYSRACADDPENLPLYAREFAQLCKELHSTVVSKTDFPSVKDMYMLLLEENPFFTEDEKARTYQFIMNAPDGDTAIHGDLQFSNAIRTENGKYFIDLGDFAYGHPYFDLGMVLLCCKYDGEEFVKNVFHMTLKQASDFWDHFAREYFGPDADLEQVEMTLRPYAGLKLLIMEKFAGVRLEEFHWLLP